MEHTASNEAEETSASPGTAIVKSEAEETSGSLEKRPEDMTNDELVVRVKFGFQKMAEHIPWIRELRARFARLPRGNANIDGCKTWKEFCEKVLHRTDRRIRQVVAASSIIDKSKSLGIPAHKTKRVDMPPASSDNWDAAETCRRLLAYCIHALEHLSTTEADHALSDLIAKLQDERRLRINPLKAPKSKTKKETGRKKAGPR